MFLLPLPKSNVKDTEKTTAALSVPKSGAAGPVRPAKRLSHRPKPKQCAHKSSKVSSRGIRRAMRFVGPSI